MLIERLMKQTGLTRNQVNHYADTASKRYKTYNIDKRDGSQREISQPSREIKALQRWLIRVIFRRLPVHNAATAYAIGASIRNNANRHVNTNFTLRTDFKDFFPSFSSEDVENFMNIQNKNRNLELSQDDITFIKKMVSKDGKLTIGAPSSPILSNLMMYDFDLKLDEWATALGVVYTRYADDIFLSAHQPESLADGMKTVAQLADKHEFGKIYVNAAKTVFLSRRAKRSITGVVITSDRQISIGRSRKREIKSLIHLGTCGKLDAEKILYLRGMLSYASDVEPSFRQSLSKKFGGEILSALESGFAIGLEN